MARRFALALGLMLGSGLWLPLPAEAQNADPPSAAAFAGVRPFRVSRAPVIDGNLDDEAWTQAPVEIGEWLSYNPLYGDRISQQTKVWAAYDDDALYFAFKCDDPEPSAIKTSIARRDSVFNDDWVGLGLDSLGTGQISYHMMVNPSGVQMDLLNSAATGEDLAPDWIWESAGRLTDTGYTVEIRLPLQSIRFKGGENVRMGVMFWRRVSRLGVSVSWPAFQPGKWVLETVAPMTFSELRSRPLREVIPSATFSSNQVRDSPSQWSGTDNQGDLGFSTKLGLTSTITLDATVNPDFSQIESDAFQVLVNQRFPVYFAEKRPFFMEGAGIFTLAGTLQGQPNVYSAVNTRTIVDPVFGAKLTGSIGRLAFGTLTAVDEQPGHGLPPATPGFERQRTFNIVRAQYSLTAGSYVGAIATDTEFTDSFNRVVGADMSLRLSSAQRIKVFGLESFSRAVDGRDSPAGFAGQARYSYDSRTLSFWGQAEQTDSTFRMDTAFVNRVGATKGSTYVEYSLYPSSTWLRRIVPFAASHVARDVVQNGDEALGSGGLSLYMTRQGWAKVEVSTGHEPFAGQEFKAGRWSVYSNAQLFRWFRFYANAAGGYATFYDPLAPYQGRSTDVAAGFNVQPNGRFSQGVDFERVAFDRDSTGERVFTVHILNTKTIYQFTNRFFLRAIMQFDSSQHRVLSDFLGSYEVRPGTVFYAGYGSLLEQRAYEREQWLIGRGDYRAVSRGLFLKASYLYRF
jgi:hypothetical protein